MEKIKLDDNKSETSDEEPANQNVIEMINETTKQVVGRVKGVLKKLNKTYGGSIIEKKDMLVSTLNKFKVYCENHKIPSDQQDFYRVFVPYNNQMPHAILKTVNPAALSNKRMIIRFADWKASSPFPNGQFVKIIGEEGKMGTETNMILHEFNVDTRPFSQKVLDCLPKEGKNWQITPEEEAKRWDLRHLNVCSVDPPGCKDIDDALHCIMLPNGNY